MYTFSCGIIKIKNKMLQLCIPIYCFLKRGHHKIFVLIFSSRQIQKCQINLLWDSLEQRDNLWCPKLWCSWTTIPISPDHGPHWLRQMGITVHEHLTCSPPHPSPNWRPQLQGVMGSTMSTTGAHSSPSAPFHQEHSLILCSCAYHSSHPTVTQDSQCDLLEQNIVNINPFVLPSVVIVLLSRN